MGVAGFDGWRSWEITLEGCFLSEELIPWRYVREKLGCKDGFSECSILSRCKQMFGFLRLLGGVGRRLVAIRHWHFTTQACLVDTARVSSQGPVPPSPRP